MTVDTINNGFNLISLDDTNRMTAAQTPKKLKDNDTDPAQPISPSSSVGSCEPSFQRGQVTVSDHKLAELAGRHAVEPLLKENPNRFVLFPIEDNEVSDPTLITY